MAIKFADTARPNNSANTTSKGTFPVAIASDVWFNDGDSLEEKWANLNSEVQTIQMNELPTATEELFGTVYQYTGDTTDDYVNGYFYQCAIIDDGSGGTAYGWVEKEVQSGTLTISTEEENQIQQLEDGLFVDSFLKDVENLPEDTDIKDKLYRVSDHVYLGDDENDEAIELARYSDIENNIIQVATLPTASSSNVGVIYQYIGNTTDDYTNGYFYQCIADMSVSPIQYSWVAIPVMEASNADSVVDCIAIADTSEAPLDFSVGQYCYSCNDGKVYKITEDHTFEESTVVPMHVEITNQLYATLSDEQKESDITWFVKDKDSPFDDVDMVEAAIGELQTNHTDTSPVLDSAKYVTSGGIYNALAPLNALFNPTKRVVGAGIRMFLDTSTAWTHTARVTGAYQFSLMKQGQGNTVFIYINNQLTTSFPVWATTSDGETELEQISFSWTPTIFVNKGDTIKITSDNSASSGVYRWFLNHYACWGIE